jgi:hypothetical protein
MSHSAEPKLRFLIEAFAIKAVEQRSRRGAIEAAIVEAEPYSGHKSVKRAFQFPHAVHRYGQSFKDWRQPRKKSSSNLAQSPAKK